MNLLDQKMMLPVAPHFCMVHMRPFALECRNGGYRWYCPECETTDALISALVEEWVDKISKMRDVPFTTA